MYSLSVSLDVCTWAMIACSQMQSSCFCSHYLCKKGCHVNRNNGSLIKLSANNYRSALIAQAHNQSPVPIESNLLKMQQQRTCRAAYRLGCNKHNTTHLLVANYIDPPLLLSLFLSTTSKISITSGRVFTRHYNMLEMLDLFLSLVRAAFLFFFCSRLPLISTCSGEQSNPRQPIQTNQNPSVPGRTFIVCELASCCDTRSFLIRTLVFSLSFPFAPIHTNSFTLFTTHYCLSHFHNLFQSLSYPSLRSSLVRATCDIILFS